VTFTTSLVEDTLTATGLESGRTYWFRVATRTKAGGGQSTNRLSEPAVVPAVTASDQQVLVAVYFAADNDLTAHTPLVLERLRRGSLVNPTAEIVYLVDEAGDENSRLYRIAGGVITPTDAVVQRFGKAEIDSADPETLAWFLQTARSLVPGAAREVVSLLGHGVGLMPEYTLTGNAVAAQQTAGGALSAASAPDAAIVPLPREKDATPTDLTSGSFLSTHDLADALALATAGGSDPFDLLFLDQCFGGSLDLLYELRAHARQFVASPNYAWLAAPYDRYLAAFAPATEPEGMGRAILLAYQAALDDSHPNAIINVSQGELETLLGAVSTLGERLIAGLAAEPQATVLAQAIAGATQGSRFVDTALCGVQGLALQPPDEQIGALRFAVALSNTVAVGDAAGVQEAAASMAQSFRALERTFRTGSPYLAPDETWLYDDALTILAPLPRASSALAAWRSTVYRQGAPFSATYAPAPALTLTIDRSFASTEQGKWDEFLAVWYTAERAPTIGQWCRYTPASFVISDTAQSVPLGATAAGVDGVAFAWEPVAGVVSWQLFLELPRANGFLKGWTLVATLPGELNAADATGVEQASGTVGYTLDGLPPGSYGARIGGLNAEGVIVAYAESTPFVINQRLLLPIAYGP
jgi:hypothetical protein